MIAIDRWQSHVCQREHQLVNMKSHEIRLAQGQRVKAVSGHTKDCQYFGMQGNFGLILLPASLFNNNFNEFLQEV